MNYITNMFSSVPVLILNKCFIQ